MKFCLFTKTYIKDLQWLEQLEASVSKFCLTPHHRVVIGDDDCESHPAVNMTLPKHKHGYLYQALVKAQAHKFTDCEYILFLDSDSELIKPFDVERDYFKDGKPIWQRNPWSNYPEEVNDKCWTKATQHFLGEEKPAEWCYMWLHYFLVHRKTCELLTEQYADKFKQLYAAARTNTFSVTEFGQYINSEIAFSEFSTLGAFAAREHPELYHWSEQHSDRPVVHRQYWSWGGFDEKVVQA